MCEGHPIKPVVVMNKLLLISIGMALIYPACTPVRVVSTEQFSEQDFSGVISYGFYEDQQGLDQNTNFQLLKEAVQMELNQRGLVNSDDPDLLINLAAEKENKVQTRKTDINDAPIYMGTRNYRWESEEIIVREYEEGTVKVDVVNASSNDLIWQGIAAGTLTGDDDKMHARIFKAMDLLFADFPVKEISNE